MYTKQRYLQVLRWFWLQQGKASNSKPAPIVGIIIDTNTDTLVDVNGDNVAAT